MNHRAPTKQIESSRTVKVKGMHIYFLVSPCVNRTTTTNIVTRRLRDSYYFNSFNSICSLSLSPGHRIGDYFTSNINNFSSLTKPINQHIVLVNCIRMSLARNFHEYYFNFLSFGSTAIYIPYDIVEKCIKEKPRKNNQNTHFGWPKGEHSIQLCRDSHVWNIWWSLVCVIACTDCRCVSEMAICTEFRYNLVVHIRNCGYTPVWFRVEVLEVGIEIIPIFQ